jgi:hypothetical protein
LAAAIARGGRRPSGLRPGGGPSAANEVSGVIVMGGHEEGVIAFGTNLDETGRVILGLIEG